MPLCPACLDCYELQGSFIILYCVMLICSAYNLDKQCSVAKATNYYAHNWRSASLLLWFHFLLIFSFRHYVEHSCNICLVIFQGLQDEIQLVPISLNDKPTWYKDVYPPAKASCVWCIANLLYTTCFLLLLHF